MDFIRRKHGTSGPGTGIPQDKSPPQLSSAIHSSSPSPAQSPSTAMSIKNTLSKIVDMPIHCDPQSSILEASLIMKEKRTHCLLIIDEVSGKLIGLTTTKDLAFRAIAKDLDMSSPISTIMSSNPYYVSQLTSPNEALKLMASKKIRHLPIVNEQEMVIGILNITTCFYNAMIRLERMSEKSKELESTFNDLNNNLSIPRTAMNTQQSLPPTRPNIPSIKIKDHTSNLVRGNMSNQLDIVALNEGLMDLNISRRKRKIINDLKSLISIMKQPDLRSLLNDNDLKAKKPFYIDAKISIWDASQLLLENNLTAALIIHSTPTSTASQGTSDSVENIIGILTTKDLVYRVLACELDPRVCKVARVMTSKPEFANDSMAIHNALRLMYEGNYLNLPIKNSNNEVTGLVNVLDLTYALLRTLNNSSIADYNSSDDDVDVDAIENANANSSTGTAARFGANLRGSANIATESGKPNENNVPAWNRFWDSLDRPLNQVSTTTRRSYSSIDKNILGKRSTSFASIVSEPTKSTSLSNTYVDVKTETGFSSISHDLGVKSMYSAIDNFESSEEKLFLKVKIVETQNLNLNLNNKIYRFDYSNTDDEIEKILEAIISKVSNKIPRLIHPQVDFHLGYLDEDQDFITIDSLEDLKLAIAHNKESYLNLILNISNKPVEFFPKDIKYEPIDNNSNFSTTYLLLGGLGIFIFVFSRLVFTGKK